MNKANNNILDAEGDGGVVTCTRCNDCGHDNAPTAEPVAQGEAVSGTFACPICGKELAHFHSAEDVCAWAAAQANRFLTSLGNPEVVIRTKELDERRTNDFRKRVADAEDMLRDAGHSYQAEYARLSAKPHSPDAADSGRVTEAMVDWLITYLSRLVVNGLHPEDARLWMKSHEFKDFDYSASAVDEADAAWNDHFANPDDDGPMDFKLSQAFVDRVTRDESGEPPVMGAALAAQGQGEAVATVEQPPEREELVSASLAIGGWLAAALDDPAVCAEMKRDINRWFDAAMPSAQTHPARSGVVSDEDVDAACFAAINLNAVTMTRHTRASYAEQMDFRKAMRAALEHFAAIAQEKQS